MSDDSESLKVVTCPTCFGKSHTLIVISKEPFEMQPWCDKCGEPLGPRVLPKGEFTWLDHNNRQ